MNKKVFIENLLISHTKKANMNRTGFFHAIITDTERAKVTRLSYPLSGRELPTQCNQHNV